MVLVLHYLTNSMHLFKRNPHPFTRLKSCQLVKNLTAVNVYTTEIISDYRSGVTEHEVEPEIGQRCNSKHYAYETAVCAL
jgi:hypothetical protein